MLELLYTIRKMTKEDIPDVQQLAKISWNDTYVGIIPENIQDKFLQNAYSETSLTWRLRQSNPWVAEVEGKIVGFAIYSLLNADGEVELGAIYLHPQFKRLKIGSALLDIARKEIPGLKRISLSVEKGNENGLKFYKTQGFQVYSEFDENFEGHVFNTVKMVLEIH